MTKSPQLLCVSVLLSLVLASSCGSGTTARAEEKQQPSIVMISVDTLRRDHVGFYGYERNTTPFLDKLAEQSLVVDQAYTTMSWTLIAHMSLLTGMYPRQHGVLEKGAVLPESIPTLAETLHDAGYHTMGFHFPGWLDPEFGFGRGFDVYRRHRNAEHAEKQIIRALAERPKDRPFFLFVHLFDAHNSPLLARNATMYDPPAPFDKIFDSEARETARTADVPTLWKKDGSQATPEQHDALVALYDGGIRYVDYKLGQWIELWSDEGWFDDALTIVTSDHGEGLMQHGGVYRGHGGIFEEGLLVPLLIRFPGARFAGERAEGAVSHVDLVPTLLEWLDLAPDEKLPGLSLLGARPENRLVFAERSEMDTYVRWPYKAIESYEGKPHILFNLEEDPNELRNLIAVRESGEFQAVFDEIVAEAKAARENRFMPTDGAGSHPIDPETDAMLSDLGYTGDSSGD